MAKGMIPLRKVNESPIHPGSRMTIRELFPNGNLSAGTLIGTYQGLGWFTVQGAILPKHGCWMPNARDVRYDRSEANHEWVPATIGGSCKKDEAPDPTNRAASRLPTPLGIDQYLNPGKYQSV